MVKQTMTIGLERAERLTKTHVFGASIGDVERKKRSGLKRHYGQYGSVLPQVHVYEVVETDARYLTVFENASMTRYEVSQEVPAVGEVYEMFEPEIEAREWAKSDISVERNKVYSESDLGLLRR